MADSASVARGIDPSVAVGLAPALDASNEDKGRYTVARFAAQNDHHVGIYKTRTKTLNFLIGEHWRTRWDGTSMSWNFERDIPDWRQQPVTNVTYAVYRSAIAKLTKQKPTLEVVPPSGNSEDREAAQLAEALLTYLWRLLRKPSKLPTAVGWILVTGETWFRVGYDPSGGPSKPRTIPVPRKKQPLGAPGSAAVASALGATPSATPPGAAPTDGNDPGSDDDDMEEVEVAADEDGEPYRLGDGSIDFAKKPETDRSGEIDFSIVNPFCVRMNPDATSIDDATEFFVATLWAKNKAAKHFGVDETSFGGADESAEQRALYEDLISATAASFPRSWNDQTSNWGVSQQNAIGDRVLVIEFYSKPDDDFPDGRHWITAGAKKVWPPDDAAQAKAALKKQVAPTEPTGSQEKANAQDGADTPLFPNGEAPLPFGFWPPLVPCFDTPIPGQPSSVPLLQQVVPINEQLDTLDGKIAEKHVMDTMGGIWFVSPEDKDIKITSEPGQVISSIAMGRRGSAFAPFQAEMKPLPEPVYRERDVLNGKIAVVTGLSGSDLSQKPEGVPSGRALLVTQETSDAVLMPLLFSLEAALEEVGRRELVIAQQKYREERVIAVRAQDGKYTYRAFRAADLRDGHDVRVQVGSMFPWSKSAQWDARMQFLQAVPGLYTNMQTGVVDEQKLAKYLDSGTPGLGAFESEDNPDLIEIRNEHDMFENYDPTTPDGSHQLPQIAFWQNSPAHLKGHYEFMKKDRARYNRWHPAARAAFKTHMMLTAVAIEDAASQMLGGDPQQAAGAPAGPDAGAPGGQPPVASGPPGGPPGAAPTPAGPPPGRGAPSLRLVAPGQSAPGAKLTASDRNSIQHA